MLVRTATTDLTYYTTTRIAPVLTAPAPAPGPDPRSAESVAAGDEAPTFELSMTQLLASAAAAVTAAVLGSRLGVAGTLIGAALASAVSMIASAVYSHSLAAARYRLRAARAAEVHGELAAVDASTQRFTPATAAHQAWGAVDAASPGSRARVTAGAPSRHVAGPAVVAPVAVAGVVADSQRRLPRWAQAGIGSLVACALALVTITGIEAIRGTPLSGGDAGGLSVLGGRAADVPDSGQPDPVELAPVVPTSGPAVDTSTGDGTSVTTTTSTTTVTETESTTSSPSSAPTSAGGSTSAATTGSPTDNSAATATGTTVTTEVGGH